MASLRNFCLYVLIIFATQSSGSPISSPNATYDWNFPQIPPSTNLTWFSCYSGHFCANLDVPIDYLNPQLGRASVPVIKKSATAAPYKGIVFLNPGGPGESGVNFLLTIPDVVLETVGPNYEIASWEPRGIGYSVPAVNACQPPDKMAIGTTSKIVMSRRHTHAEDMISGPNLPLDSFYLSSSEDCKIYMGGPLDAGPHMTTATVARDLISILDAYTLTSDAQDSEQDPKLLNYWGFSYGSMIGMTFSSMFPSRVGRVAIDGVMDAESWVSGGYESAAVDEDAVFATFFQYCHLAGRKDCAFYTGTKPHDISLRFEALISGLNVSYAREQGWSNASAIELTLTFIQFGLAQAVYAPIERFPALAEALVSVEALISNVTTDTAWDLRNILGLDNPVPGPGDTWNLGTLVNRFPAVACTDTGGLFYNSSFEAYSTRLPILQKQSWVGGNNIFSNLLSCLGWPITSDDVFAGPFGGVTNMPLLVVSNTLDPATPHMNGEKAARIFHGAELLTIEGTGHLSLASQNSCAFTKIAAFFQKGVLPGEDNYCPLEAGPWNVNFAGPLKERDDLVEIRDRFRELRER